MDNPLLSELENQGCNIQQMLVDTFMNNEALYVKLLKKLKNNKSLDKLADAYAAGDVKACFEASHDLKGMYATLGLKPLFTLCCAIVEPARNNSLDGAAQNLAALQQEHARFLDIIEKG